MQQLIRINRIRERAGRIGASLTQLCVDAGKPPSTVYRWLSGETEPRLLRYEQTCEALEEVLTAREKAMLQHLTAGDPQS